MFYLLLKAIFKIALRVFFRQLEVRNRHLIPTEGPLLIAANHPNTFMDPVAIASVVVQEVYFLAKSTVFSSPLTKWLLKRMNLVPVYRREDGNTTAQANDDTFRQCYDFLAQNGTLLIFPEGNSFNERRLRPLKSGAARIALGAAARQDFKVAIKIVPIGLNYSNPTQFQSKLFINIGEPILVSDYEQDYALDSFKTAQRLTQDLKTKLEELIVITTTEEENELVQQIESIYKNDLAADLNLAPGQAGTLTVTKSIIESVQYFQKHEPSRVTHLQEKIRAYQQSLKKLGLHDRYLRAQTTPRAAFFKIIYLSLGWPFYLWGSLTNYLPYYIPGKIADKITDEQEFRAPIMMTAGIFTFGAWYSLLFYGCHRLMGNWWLMAVVLFSVPVCGFFALHYWFRLTETRGYVRLYSLLYNKQPLLHTLRAQRAAVVQDLEEAKTIYLQVINHKAADTSSLS